MPAALHDPGAAAPTREVLAEAERRELHGIAREARGLLAPPPAR